MARSPAPVLALALALQLAAAAAAAAAAAGGAVTTAPWGLPAGALAPGLGVSGASARTLLQGSADCLGAIPNCVACTFRSFGSVTRAVCSRCSDGYRPRTGGRECCECAPGGVWGRGDVDDGLAGAGAGRPRRIKTGAAA
jgi:hypothetical protein